MATRSFIARSLKSSFEGVYCHYDGYLEYNGAILRHYYSEASKVKKLISLGDISTLGKRVGRKHDFNKRTEEQTTYYGRDRGELHCGKPTPFIELNDLVVHASEAGCEFIYLFDSGRWYFLERTMQFFGANDGTPFGGFEPLTHEMTKAKPF